MRIAQKPRTLNVAGFATFDLGTFKTVSLIWIL